MSSIRYYEKWFKTRKEAQKARRAAGGGQIKELWTLGVDESGNIAPVLMYRLKYKQIF